MLDCTFSPTRWEFHSRFTLIIRIQRVSSTTVRCGSSHHFRHRGCLTVVLFQFVWLDAMVHVYGARYQSLTLARSRVPETASYPHHFAKRPGVGRRFCCGHG